MLNCLSMKKRNNLLDYAGFEIDKQYVYNNGNTKQRKGLSNIFFALARLTPESIKILLSFFKSVKKGEFGLTLQGGYYDTPQWRRVTRDKN